MAVAHKFEERARTNDVVISESVDFTSLMLSKPVLNGLKNAGFERPSPIQLKAIPLGRCGLDLIVQAKSGTGKTCVFSVVALEGIEPSASSTQVLVLAPTREIALQIWEVMCSLGSAMATLRCHTFIGGMPVHEDRKKLQLCHIAVGTPGRIQSLIDQGLLKTQSIRLFVLDEADKLLEEGFQPQINWIYSALPDNKQMLALSATYPEYLANHLTLYMRNPTFVRLNITDPALRGIKQYYITVPSHPLPHRQFEAKTAAVVSLLSSITFNQCLIFSNWQTRAQNLQNELSGQGWPTSCIAGCLEQKDRITAITQLKTYSCRVLISTDLTSRGIDADRVNLVINLDVPGDQETYLHRIGRAGRFGSYGAGVTIVSEGQELIDLHKIEHSIGTHILPLPDPVPNDLVNRQLLVRLEDVVSTEQIFTQPGSDIPRPEHTARSKEVNKAAQMVKRSDHHSLLSDDSQEDTVQVAVSAECRQQMVPLSAGTGSVHQPSQGTDRVNVTEDGDSTVLSEPDKDGQGSKPSPLYTACASRASQDGARTGGDVERQCGNGARSRWCGGEVGSAPAVGREAEATECCPDSSRIMISPGQKTKDNDLSVDSRGLETASAPVSVDVEDKETSRRPLENCCVNGELGAGAHEANGQVSTDGTYPCLVNNSPSGGMKGILVGACVESARLDSGDGPSVLPPSLATECCGLADAKQTAADPADTGSSSAHTTHVQSIQQKEGVVHKSCVISQAALSDQQPHEALGSAPEDLRHDTYNGDNSTAGSNEDKHILENDKICQSLGQNHISLRTKHVDPSGSTPVSSSALDGSASPGASARQRGEGAECSDCPAGSAWGQNSMKKSTKMVEVSESTARNGMKNKKTRAVGDLWASMLKDDQDYVPRSPQHNTSLLETSADLQDSPRLKDTAHPGRKDVSWETELAMYVAVRSKMGSFPASKDKGDDEENEDEESRTEMRSRVHRPVSQAKRRLPKSACTGDHKNQNGRAEDGQTAVRSLCGPDEEHVTRNAPKHSLTPAMSPEDQQTRTAPCVKGLGPEPSPMTTTERHEVKSTIQNSQAIGKARVSDNPTAYRLEQSDSTGIFPKDNLVERSYVPPPKISMFFQRQAERKAVPLTYGSALHHYLQCLEESSLPAVKTADTLVQQTFTASSTQDQEQHQQLLHFLTHFRTQPGAKGGVCSTQGLGVETEAGGDAKQRALEVPGNANALSVKAASVPEGAGDTMTGNTTEEKSIVPTFIADNKSVIVKEENSFTPKSSTVTITSSGSGNKSLFSVTTGAGREKTVGRNVRAPRYRPMAVCGPATAHLFQEGASSSQKTAAGSPTDLHSSVASSSEAAAAAMVPCQMTSDVGTLPQGVAASEVTAGVAELCRTESSGQNTANRSTSSNTSSEHGRPVPRLQSEVDVNGHTVFNTPSEHDRPVPKTQTSAGLGAVCQEDTVRHQAVSLAQTSAILPSVSPVERGAIPRQTHAKLAGACSMGKGAIPKHHSTRAQAVWDSSADSSCDSSSSSSTSSTGEDLKMPEGEAEGWMCFQNQYAVESCAQRHRKKRGTRAGVKKGQEEQPRHQTPLSSQEKRPEKKHAHQKMLSTVSKGKGAETNHSAPFNELYGYPEQTTVQSAAYWPHNVQSSSNQSNACPPFSPYPSSSWLSYYSPSSLYSLYHGGKSVQEKTNGYYSYLGYDLQEQTAPNFLPFSQPQRNQGSHYHSSQLSGGYAFPSFQATSPFAHPPSTHYHDCPCHDSRHRAVCHCCPSQRMHSGCDQQYCHAGRSHQPAVHCAWQKSQACASMPAGSPCVAASAESQSLRHAARAHSMQRYIQSMAKFYARVCTRDA